MSVVSAAPPAKVAVGMFAAFVPLIRAADGLTLSQVCALSSLEPSTVQNWIKRGFVPHPVGKKYHERHLSRIMLIADLRECLQIDRIGSLMRFINGNADDESDDIIPEETLYDLFHEVAHELDSGLPPDGIEPVIERCAVRYLPDDAARERVARALAVMSYAYIAGRYKQRADGLYIHNILSDKE